MSSTANNFGGQLHVSLSLSNNRVQGVDIQSTRPNGATEVFVGQSPSVVTSTLGMLFSLCGRAQTIAALMAVENAQGLHITPEHAAARTILRQAEMLSQTAMRICLDWPRLLGLDNQASVVRACLGAETELENALFNGATWKIPGGVGADLNVNSVKDLIHHLQEEVIAPVLNTGGLADDLRHTLTDLNLNGFGKLTDIDLLEDGALRRHWDTPTVQAARQTYGIAMCARLEARLADLATLPISMMDATTTLGPLIPSSDTAHENGAGQAWVDTARGSLTHTVTITDGRVAAYTIAAPTDANFAPNGPVAMGLMDADATDLKALIRAAELHVLSVDPCVQCIIEFQNV